MQVPKKLDKSLVGGGVVKSVLDWEHKHGVHLNPGKAPPLPPGEMASLVRSFSSKMGLQFRDRELTGAIVVVVVAVDAEWT